MWMATWGYWSLTQLHCNKIIFITSMLFVLISLFQFKLSVGTCASCLGCWTRPFLFAMPFSTQRSNPTLEMIGKIFEIAWSRNFKIELGLELVYYTIRQDWEVVISGDGGHCETLKKSWWTRQAQLSPFNFKKVFVKKIDQWHKSC